MSASGTCLGPLHRCSQHLLIFGCFTYLRRSCFPVLNGLPVSSNHLTHILICLNQKQYCFRKDARTEHLRCTPPIHYIRTTKMGSTAVHKKDYIYSSTYPYHSTDSTPSQQLSPFCRTLDLTEINDYLSAQLHSCNGYCEPPLQKF